MEDLIRRAAHQLERNGRSGEEREETGHALTAAGVGRGDRCGRNAGNRGYGERDLLYTTARTTARGEATTPPNASSCVENLTDTAATSTNTC